MPQCSAPIVLNDIPVGEICHIKARSKKGPRCDASLTQAEKDDYPNLLLLCRTCHKLVDSDETTYTSELLTNIKELHEKGGGLEITPQVSREAEALFQAAAGTRSVSAKSNGGGISVAVGDHNKGNITITQKAPRKSEFSRYPQNSIGADANLAGYIDYLFGLAVEYWSGVEAMNPGRLGKKIKVRFSLKSRTRHHLAVERFPDLVDFIITQMLRPSPVGRRHERNGTKLYSTFEEWRYR